MRPANPSTPYSIVMTPYNAGNAAVSKDLGHEIDLLWTIAINPRHNLMIGYSHFNSGDYYDTPVWRNNVYVTSSEGPFQEDCQVHAFDLQSGKLPLHAFRRTAAAGCCGACFSKPPFGNPRRRAHRCAR